MLDCAVVRQPRLALAGLFTEKQEPKLFLSVIVGKLVFFSLSVIHGALLYRRVQGK